MRLSTRHLLSVRDLTVADVELILKTTDSLKQVSEREIKKVPALRGRTVVNCFFEDSTRTRVSFELAEKRLSADTLNFSVSGSAMAKKGETFVDTIKNIEAMNPDIFVIRDAQSGAPFIASQIVKGRVINAGDGLHEHPTQALLDLFTIQEKCGRLKGLHVGIVGDIAHSRVARSDMLLFTKMGMKVTAIGPQTLLPSNIETYGVQTATFIDDVIEDLDVLMALRIQRERMDEHLFPSLREYATYFGVNQALLSHGKDNLIVMHPGPV
ncbi:MAG: aspartate carbamoyltransferase catalytic subunit, partial [Deltaproteobacteria bacterium]|nr:aspartate carbamoyltransferase catalytic subunit [Deltaproteobacteria bacterium]